MQAKTKSTAEHDEAVADRELIIERVIDAPARLVFLAYSKPEHVVRWFGPRPYPLTKCEMDFRVGGEFHFAMTGPDGVQNPGFGGVYLEIVQNEKITYTNAFEAPGPSGSETMVVTLTFHEQGSEQQGNVKTKLTMHTLFASAAMKAEHTKMGFVQGVNIGLDQLQAVIAQLQQAGASR